MKIGSFGRHGFVSENEVDRYYFCLLCRDGDLKTIPVKITTD